MGKRQQMRILTNTIISLKHDNACEYMNAYIAAPTLVGVDDFLSSGLEVTVFRFPDNALVNT